MKKNTTKKFFSKRIAQYGALTAIIGAAADANGQIIYTDINPDEGGAGVVYSLDMDNNSVPDFVITNYNSSSSSLFNINVLYVTPTGSNGILGNTAIYYSSSSSSSSSSSVIGYPFALNQNAGISAGNTNWVNEYYQLLNLNSCGTFLGNGANATSWCGVTDKYIGVKFKIGNNTHYGWVRMDVTTPSNWLVKDYAYNSTPNASINAGQTTLGVEENVKASVKIVTMNKTVALYNLSGNTQYALVNMMGQMVLQGTTKEQHYVIDAGAVSSGIYLVVVTDEATGASIRKKIRL